MKKSFSRILFMTTAIGVISGCGQAASPAKPIKKDTHKVVSSAKKGVHKAGKDVSKTTTGGGHKTKSSTTTSSKTKGLMGAKLFAASCETCHGKGGIGSTSAPRLAKPSTVPTRFATQSALELFIAHNMPANNPGSLTPSQDKSIASYVWHLAGK